VIRALKDYFVATVLERTLHWGGICFKWGVSIASSCKYVYKTLCFICKCTCRWPPQTWRMMSRISTRNRPLRKNMIDLNWSMFIQLCRDAASKIALPRFHHHQSLIFPAHFRCLHDPEVLRSLLAGSCSCWKGPEMMWWRLWLAD